MRKAADHALAFVHLDGTETAHTSLLYRGMEWGGFSTDNSENNAAVLLRDLRSPRYDFVRETAEFGEITAELTQYAGEWSRPE